MMFTSTEKQVNFRGVKWLRDEVVRQQTELDAIRRERDALQAKLKAAEMRLSNEVEARVRLLEAAHREREIVNQQPVAWRVPHRAGATTDEGLACWWRFQGLTVEPLYTKPAESEEKPTPAKALATNYTLEEVAQLMESGELDTGITSNRERIVKYLRELVQWRQYEDAMNDSRQYLPKR